MLIIQLKSVKDGGIKFKGNVVNNKCVCFYLVYIVQQNGWEVAIFGTSEGYNFENKGEN